MAKGRGTLAPVYDMMPMRWQPDAALGGAPDYVPFSVDDPAAAGGAAAPARAFWGALSIHPEVSRGLRRVAAHMAGAM